MPVERANILGEFLSAIEGLVERPRPTARQPMRAPAVAGPQGGPDLEAARRAAGPARASQVGEEAVRGALAPERGNARFNALQAEFEALVGSAQNNPEPRFRGELRPDVRSQPPASPQPPTGLQNAPLSTAQLRSVQERFGQVQRAPYQSGALPTPVQTTTHQAFRYPQGPAPPPSGPRPGGDRLHHPDQPSARLPTPAQTTTRQALTPSRATQPQTGGARTPPQSVWDVPNTRNWFNTHLQRQLGMNPQEFEQYYFAGFARQPSVSVAGNNLHLDAAVRAPQDMVAPGRNGGPEVRIPAGTYLGTIRRQIMPQQREVYNAYFALDPQYQGLGIARTVFRNQIDVYRRMGNIDRVTVSAGLDGGGHTWARFGFVPTLSTWQGLRNTLLSRLRGISNLPPAQSALAEAYIRSDDPYAIRALAALSMMPGGADSGLGRRLLGGTGWRGTLNMRDPRDMNYFDAYVQPRPRQ